jgi:hypothetical protein
MKTTTFACIALIVTCGWLQACTTPRQPFPVTDMIATGDIPPADPALDHYVARVPGDIAETATVARAKTHITLGRARDLAGQQLCAGNRLIPGEVVSVTGPFPAADPDGTGQAPVWYYRISQQPGLRGCDAVQEARLFEVMQSELPSWIRIERAGSSYTALGLLE